MVYRQTRLLYHSWPVHHQKRVVIHTRARLPDRRNFFCHRNLSVLYPRMAPEAVDLLLGDMFFMDSLNVFIHIGSFDMTEVAFILGGNAISPGYFRMALSAGISSLESCFM